MKKRWQVMPAVRRAVFAVVLALLLVVWPVGCTTRVVPPRGVVDPVAVYLLDHGHTPSLVLPTPSGGLARYAYGDWRYYALEERSIWSGLRALVLPSQGALGYMPLVGPAEDEAAVREQVDVVTEAWFTLEVERSAAYGLHAALQRQYAAERATEVLNLPAELAFVHHPQSYTWFYNSNHAVADWLRELGCEVRGPAFISSWRVEEP